MPDPGTIGQRITQLIQQLGITKNAFAQSLGKTATVIQHLVDERNKPGYDLLCKIVEVYPNVSLQWLMLGELPMLHSHPTVTSSAPEPSIAPADNGIDLSEVPDVPRRRNGTLLQPADIAATLALAAHGPPKNSSVPVSQPRPAPALAPTTSPAQPPPPVSPAGSAASTPPSAPEAPALPQPPAVSAPLAPPAAIPALPDASYLAAALQTQYLQHQLALAEQRNQHLLEQQALLQQMVQLLQRAV